MTRPILALTLMLACVRSAPGLAEPGTQEAPALAKGQAAAVFAGGCFWCVESAFEAVEGVLQAVSGYTGGTEPQPTYSQVSAHGTSHYEAVRVVYDPTQVTYAELLQVFWHNIDPTQADGQFCDRGHQYRSAVFTSNPEERALTERTKAEVAAHLGKPVVTEVLPAAVFWVAEEYHQDFYEKNPVHYQAYRQGCGRDRRLQQLWGPKAGH